MNPLPEEDYLTLSGIQHFAFCRRQWALIYIEGIWSDNLLTTEGDILHERVHNEPGVESHGDILITRGLRVISHRLMAQGVCDVVEFHKSPCGISLSGHRGKWIPYPVEYKRGSPKQFQADELQLCAQAMCLEEMLLCSITEGSLFYGEPRRRTEVIFDAAMREKVEGMLKEMRELNIRGHTPKARPTKGCSSCSLKNLCLPRLVKNSSPEAYLRSHLPEEENK